MNGETDDFTYLYDQSVYAGQHEASASSFPTFLEEAGQWSDQQPSSANAFGAAMPFPPSHPWTQGVTLPFVQPNQVSFGFAMPPFAHEVAETGAGDWLNLVNLNAGMIDW